MYFIYVLRSLSSGQNYIGSTDNLLRRFKEHDRNQERATRNRGPWEMIHWEVFENRTRACRREKFLKTGTGYTWRKENGLL